MRDVGSEFGIARRAGADVSIGLVEIEIAGIGPITSLYASYLQRDPWFQDANLRALSGRTCPRPDQAFLQRLIDYGIATGYLRGRTVQRTSG